MNKITVESTDEIEPELGWRRSSLGRPLLNPQNYSVRSSMLQQSMDFKNRSKVVRAKNSLGAPSNLTFHGTGVMNLDKNLKNQSHRRFYSMSRRRKGNFWRNLNGFIHQIL